ncbi:MerR family DNA-binding transcriptional regulator [Niallia sp. 01092]|uniref:MerR family DNA-binding transcriptional regulator n=1 Tax=unclassified Niallia TaxID=2837522 RepID=UPI003FCF4FC8
MGVKTRAIQSVNPKQKESIHILRYYENEGIMPFIKRNDNGIRIYEKEELDLYAVFERRISR